MMLFKSVDATLLLALTTSVAAAGWTPAASAQAPAETGDLDFDALFGPEAAEESAAPAAPEVAPAAPEPVSAAAPAEETQQPAAAAEAPVEAGMAEGTPEPQPVEMLDTIQLGHKQEPEAPQLKEAAPKPKMMVEEIVVTARKREESLQEVPLSVSAFSAGQLEQRGFGGLEDIASATPGFTFEGFASGGAHGNPVIRGLAQTFTTSRVQNVSFFLDGVYLQRQSMLNLGMVDMERIEVVKGPQNALYGRNAFAGAVNYVTRKPSEEPTGYLFTEHGDNQRQQYRLSLGGPLNQSGTLLGKVSAGWTDYDGATHNNHPVANADPAGPNLSGNLGGNDDATYSLSLSYKPTDKLQLRGSFYRSELEHEAAPSYSLSGVNAARFGFRKDSENDLNCNTATVNDISPFPPRTHTGYSAWCGELPRYASDVADRKVAGMVVDPRAIGTISRTNVITFVTDYDISDPLSVHYLFGFADHDTYTDGGASDEDPLVGRGIATNALITTVDNQNSAGYTYANTASGRPNNILESLSHELRFDWQVSDELRTSFGAYYSEVEDEEWTSLFISDLCNADTPENIQHCNEPLSAPNHLADATVLTAAAAYDQYVRQHGGKLRGEWTAYEESIAAAFASFSYKFTDSLEGTFETRYTLEKKKVKRLTDSSMLAPGESITYTFPLDPVLPFGNTLTSQIAVPEDEADFNNFTPRAILNWSFAEEHMLYGSVAKGVKTGGFNNANTESELTYDQEENWTYELGSKNRFMEGRLTLNGSLYYVDWTNLQGGVPPSVAGLSTSDVIANIGGAQSLGVEIDGSLHLTENFYVDFGGTYNDASYKDGTKYASGNQETGSVHCDGVTCPADGDVGGNQLARTSKIQYTVGLNVSADIRGWSLGGRLDTNYQSKQYVDPLNLGWAPERQLYNASMRLASPEQQWEMGAWCKNLTDEDYAANAFLIGVFNQYLVAKGQPRTFGFNLKYNF